jgi:hypothetical protein
MSELQQFVVNGKPIEFMPPPDTADEGAHGVYAELSERGASIETDRQKALKARDQTKASVLDDPGADLSKAAAALQRSYVKCAQATLTLRQEAVAYCEQLPALYSVARVEVVNGIEAAKQQAEQQLQSIGFDTTRFGGYTASSLREILEWAHMPTRELLQRRDELSSATGKAREEAMRNTAQINHLRGMLERFAMERAEAV